MGNEWDVNPKMNLSVMEAITKKIVDIVHVFLTLPPPLKFYEKSVKLRLL